MPTKLKPISEQVIVITGASSGIGLATAQAAAAAGARVVLTARSRDALVNAVDAIKHAGGEATFAVADVASEAELQRVAGLASERFGGFDTWINNAGVGVWGLIEEISEADMRRLFDTNFWGVVHGSRIAARHLREKGGAIINIGSVASDYAFPVQGIYSASKQAVRGFTEALRTELRAERAPISVTLVKPASISTPLPEHVKNYHEEQARLPPPVYRPEDAARTILRAAAHPVRTAYVGGGARITGLIGDLAPQLLDWIGATVLIPAQFANKRSVPGENLHTAFSNAQVQGELQAGRPSLYSRLSRHPAATALAVSAAAAGAGLFVWSRRPKNGKEAELFGSTEAEEALVEAEGHPS